MTAPAIRARVYMADEVAAMFGRSVDWLYAHRATLEAEKAFPKPWSGRPYSWLRYQVDAWFEGRTVADPDKAEVSRQRAHLALVYGGRR